MALEPGARVGPYEIQECLGAGGMGEVYKALDLRLGRIVALKVLPSDQVADAAQKRRFLLEAKAVSALNHPNIVTIYDIGTENGVDYMAMEYVEGQDLDDSIPRHGLRLPQLLGFAVQAADALAQAHGAGIIHRDLKPANLMIATSGQVKLLDFGISKVAMASAAAGVDDVTRTLSAHTGEGPLMGTTAYMSPEQAEGKDVDARSDIFSFGSLLYEMATGQRAFHGASRLAVLSSILRDDPKSMAEARPELPPELVRVIARCLRKDPARRFQHMDDLKVALQELKEDFESGALAAAAPLSMKKGRGWLWLAAAVVAGAGLVAWRTVSGPAAIVAPLRPLPLTSYPGNEWAPSFSPDGSQVAFVWNGEKKDNDDIYVKLVGPGAPLRLTTNAAQDLSPQWSPDGRNIAFVRRLEDGREAILTMPALGGTERRIAVLATRGWGTPYASLCWSPDSKKLLVSGAQSAEGPNSLHWIAPDTGEVRQLTHPEPKTDGDIKPAFSPDGRTLVFIRLAGLNVGSLMRLRLSANLEPEGEPEAVELSNLNPIGFAWIGSRDLVVNAGDTLNAALYRVPASGSHTPRVVPGIGPGVRQIAVSPSTGRIVYSYFSQDTNVWRVDLKNPVAEAEKFMVSTFREVFPQYSPDGKRISFHSNRSGSVQIWVANADGSEPSALTSMTGTTTGSARWSPDGQHLCFDSNTGGNWQVYTVATEGGQPRQMTNDGNTNIGASWSRDGRWLYFGSRRTGRFEVWKMPPAGGAATQVTHDGGVAAVESPDGKTLYYSRESGDGIWKMPVDGGPETQVVKSLFRNNFAVTNGGIYFTPSSEPSVQFTDFVSGATRTLAQLAKRPDLGLALSPDGRYLLFTLVDFEGSDLMLAEGLR
jgi:Tol biopolymer transport system component